MYLLSLLYCQHYNTEDSWFQVDTYKFQTMEYLIV